MFNTIENFFNLNGRKAVVFDNKNHLAALYQTPTSTWKTAAKILLFATIVIPILLLIAKAVGRAVNPSVEINQCRGLDWAMTKEKTKTFNKILEFTPLNKERSGGPEDYVKYALEKDDPRSIDLILRDYSDFLPQVFKDALEGDSPKILEHLWNAYKHSLNPDHGKLTFAIVVEELVATNNLKSLGKLQTLYTGTYDLALKKAQERNNVKIVGEIINLMTKEI